MAGQKFEYDESGGTFYYFVLSVFALLLIPSTFYWWPRKEKNDDVIQNSTCTCPGCKKKDALLQKRKPWKTFSSLATKLLIISGWCFLIFLTYKVSQFDYEYINFDPYEILQIPLGSSEKTVKKAYRKLSLILHPDKETGDEKAFMKLTKAYQALTDDEARKNWERYGNPDGPGAMSFGIALPSWIVEKENSFWVLGLYAAVFMIALPTIVGMWWYKSIKYSNDKVLLETSRMYYHFFHKTPAMPMKRAIMILTASLEFDRKYNSELCDRDSDAIEMPKLISQLHNLNEKLREIPFCYKYSVKARALVHAHLSRIPLSAKTLDIDRMAIIKKCPHLIQEMINCISHLILLAYAQRVPRLMNIETLENCMKLCAMIVQGLWEYKSPLLQLPHIQEDHMKHFTTRKRMIRNVQQFAKLKNDDKRQILKFLKDEQYEDVIKAISNMPYIEFDVRCEVIDDEATTVYTAGAIVTVTVTLKRSNLSEFFNDETAAVVDTTGEVDCKNQRVIQDESEKSEKLVTVEEEVSSEKLQQKGNSKVNWQKRSHKPLSKKNKKQSSQQMKKQQLKTKKKQNWERKQKAKQELEKPETENDGEDNNDDKLPVLENDGEVSDEQLLSSDENVESDMEEEETNSNNDGQVRDDDDDDWDKFQSDIKKKDWLAGRKKQSHLVHCPYFPEEKQEYWWVYVSDRKSKTLLTSPYHITELVDYDEIQLKFTAPNWPGLYTFAVCLRSDSYLGFDQMRDIKLDVKEAPKVPTEHPQWDISDEEDEDNQVDNGGDLSEYTTDEDVEEE